MDMQRQALTAIVARAVFDRFPIRTAIKFNVNGCILAQSVDDSIRSA